MNNKTIDFRVEGLMPGEHERRKVTSVPVSTLGIDIDGNPEAVPVGASTTNFELLPAATVVVGSDKLTFTTGVGTEVISRAAKGGVNLQTQVTTPADGDDVNLAAVAAGGLATTVRTLANVTFDTRVSITTITTLFVSVGLSEVITNTDPTVGAGEGALFLFDPTEEVTTGLTTAQHANWILAHKVNGVDTFTATDIQVNAGQDYDFKIIVNDDLTASYYIGGVLKGASPALTSGDAISAYAGIELTAGAQRDMDVRYMRLSRLWI